MALWATQSLKQTPTGVTMWCERLVLVLISLLAGGCAGQWAVVKGYRVVMKADIVRDFPGMCYDVSSCSARAVNESWAIGSCSRAACEVDESGILLEVHYTCPRLQNRPTLMCDIIEDKRLPFPACCPRMICQRHKKQPPPTQTKLKPFTPHATVDKELRKIPFVLKRFLEVQNTTLLDAIILNRIKALEAAANASVVYMGQTFNMSFNGSSDVDGFSEAALTTEGPGTTTQDTTPFATTEDTVTTPSPTPSTTAQTVQVTTTTTEAPVVILNGSGFQSESLEFQPRQNVSIDDDELSFLNDAPLVPADDTTPPSQPETAKTTTVEKTTSETATTRPDVVPVTSAIKVTTEVTESVPASPTEHTTTTEVHDTTRTVALTVPESIFHTTILPSTEPPTTTTAAPVQDELKTKSTPGGKKDSNLPTILRSLVDNVFDYYDYIDYYVPGQKRNASSTQEKEAGAVERRKIPESMMELVKEQLTKQTTRNETVATDGNEELPQGDQPSSEEPETTTADPDDQELQKELVTKVEVDLHRVPKLGSQEDSTRAPATTATTAVTQATTTKAVPITTETTKASERPVSTTATEQQVRTEQTTEASINLVKSAGAEQPRRGINLLIENLAAPEPEQSSTTGATTASSITTQAPTTITTTTQAPQTPASTTQEATTATPTTPEATEPPATPRASTTTTVAPTTRPATTLAIRTVPFEVVTTNAPRTTQTAVTTQTPSSTTVPPTTTTSPATSAPTTPKPTSHRAETDATITEVQSTQTNAPTSSGTPTTSAPTNAPSTGDVLITKTAPPLSSESLIADRRNATVTPLLTTPEATTVGVTTSTTTPAPSTVKLTTQQAKQSAATGSNLKTERTQKTVNGTTKSPNAPSQNNDVEYIDYVYYYDYVDIPDNSTTNGTSSSRNSTGVQPTQLKQNVTQ
ncbi:mucin-2 [Ixodes scapularis]|uniref:mucin-2 n=1 Tax=Ixodes scapularis TaxID=6945 RepID=UPI001AD6E549|nr:mucin-2 [Ixodes scapularis]